MYEGMDKEGMGEGGMIIGSEKVSMEGKGG